MPPDQDRNPFCVGSGDFGPQMLLEKEQFRWTLAGFLTIPSRIVVLVSLHNVYYKNPQMPAIGQKTKAIIEQNSNQLTFVDFSSQHAFDP